MSVDEEFEVVNGNAKFLCRNGAAFERGQAYSQKKLCFTSTARDLLARHLLLLSKREDCFFVKFGVVPRGGMYLGRCFLMTDEAVGKVWAEYKSHPSLFCTVQDDDFVERFRELSFAYDHLWIDDDHASPPGTRRGAWVYALEACCQTRAAAARLIRDARVPSVRWSIEQVKNPPSFWTTRARRTVH
jgi:hypothetical protein